MFVAARARLGTLLLSHATPLRPLVLHGLPRGFGASEWTGPSVRAMSSGGHWGWWGRGGDDDDDKKDGGDAESGGEKDSEAEQGVDGEGSKSKSEAKKGRRRRRTETEARGASPPNPARSAPDWVRSPPRRQAIEVVDNNAQSRGQNAQRVRTSGGSNAALTRVGSGARQRTWPFRGPRPAGQRVLTPRAPAAGTRRRGASHSARHCATCLPEARVPDHHAPASDRGQGACLSLARPPNDRS